MTNRKDKPTHIYRHEGEGFADHAYSGRWMRGRMNPVCRAASDKYYVGTITWTEVSADDVSSHIEVSDPIDQLWPIVEDIVNQAMNHAWMWDDPRMNYVEVPAGTVARCPVCGEVWIKSYKCDMYGTPFWRRSWWPKRAMRRARKNGLCARD